MIALHCGLGTYSISDEDLRIFKLKIISICNEAVQQIQNQESSLDTVVKTIASLEDCPYTNAGIGSSLTRNGFIEMEAGLMDGRTNLFSGISCLRGFKNPINIAKKLLLCQESSEDGGLVKPQHLCSDGAASFALEHNFQRFDDSIFQTTYSKKQHKAFERRFGKINTENFASMTAMDTIGAICVDLAGNISSGASSGGLAYKPEGRIGHVSLPSGSGTWVDQTNCIGACTTGVGELISREIMARKACEFMAQSRDFASSFEDYHQSIRRRKTSSRNPCLFGGLCLHINEAGSRSVSCFLNGLKLLVAFAIPDKHPKLFLIDTNKTHESALVVEQWFI